MCLCLCIFFIFLVIGCESKYGCVTQGVEKSQVYVSDYLADLPELNIARATYRNDINSTGWAYLELHTSAEYSDDEQAYAAGYLEGFLTRDLIWMHWQNMLKGYCYNKTDVCGMIEDYLDRNEKYISSMTVQYPLDPYWYQMKLYYIQLEGLAHGYKEATTDPYEQLTMRDMLWINMLGDLDELAFALSIPLSSADLMLFSDHCTGLVKLLPDRSELYTAQVTWNSYQSMLRFQKMYILQYKMSSGSDQRIPGYKMSLSSYPGFLQSLDDFYVISSGLVAAETTIGNSNRTLFELVKPVGQVLEFARAMVANRLANSGREWVEIFRKYNSGTYNNQWYIVDYKRFDRRTNSAPGVVHPGLLWVLEQLPGHTQVADLTSELVRTSYWPSYNIPYFPRIFNLSGGNERLRVFGDWFGYETNPRGRIIKQQQAEIRNLADMYRTMRYNDYKHDPHARCAACSPPYSACNAIAARNDLNPANGQYIDYKHDPHARCAACSPPYSACNAIAARNDLNPANGQYNDYKHDPHARCAACSPPYSACNAIAARNDLNPANGQYIDYKHDPHARCAACSPPYSACNAIAARNDLNPANGQYNDYKHDPHARCAACSPPYSACNAIAARNDLNPANGQYNDYKHDPHARCAACSPPYSACNAIAARNDLNPANGQYIDYKHDPHARCAACSPPYSACNAIAARNDLNPANGQYIDYKHDPHARCAACSPPYSACNAIAARNDLNPANGTYPFRALGHRSHGGTDAKITSAVLRRTYQFVAVSSPTHNLSRGIPPFQWSRFDMGPQITHLGHPDMWVFPPVLHNWEWA